MKLVFQLKVITSTMAIWKLSGLFEIADIASFSLQNAETVKGTYMRVNSHGKRRHKRQITTREQI